MVLGRADAPEEIPSLSGVGNDLCLTGRSSHHNSPAKLPRSPSSALGSVAAASRSGNCLGVGQAYLMCCYLGHGSTGDSNAIICSKTYFVFTFKAIQCLARLILVRHIAHMDLVRISNFRAHVSHPCPYIHLTSRSILRVIYTSSVPIQGANQIQATLVNNITALTSAWSLNSLEIRDLHFHLQSK